MGGFTYCGRRCDEFGVQYAPKDAQKQTRIAPYEQFSKDVPGKHGGYYYGNRVPTRIFEMPCLIDGIDDAA